MANITLENSAEEFAGHTSGTTSLTGYNFVDNPLITNFVSREDFPGNTDITAVPYGLQENFSIVFNGLTQYVQGDLDPANETLIVGDDYTVCGWVKFNDWGAFTALAGDEVRELINSRYVGPAFREAEDIVNFDGGFTLGVKSISGGDLHYFTLNINGKDYDVDATDITLDTWYWFAIVKNGATAELYVTASEDGFVNTDPSVISLTGLTNTSWDTIRIARAETYVDAPTDYYFECQMVDLQIWNTALSTTALEETQYAVLVPPQAETSGLRYYYRFNPAFNNIIKDSNYRRNDFIAIGFGGNPFIQDSPTDFGNTALRCLDFPGNGEYLVRYDNSNTSAGGGTTRVERVGVLPTFENSYTVEFWVKFDVLPGVADDPVGLVSKWNADIGAGVAADERGWKFVAEYDGGLATAVINFYAQTDTAGGDDDVAYTFEPVNPITTGVWYHVAVVKDVSGTLNGGTKNYHFYLHKDNSVLGDDNIIDDLSAAFTVVGDEVYQPTNDLLVGAVNYWDVSEQLGQNLNGKMINLRIWTTYRTSAQITTQRNQFLNF